MAVASVLHYRVMGLMGTGADELYGRANQTATESLQSVRVVAAYNLQVRCSGGPCWGGLCRAMLGRVVRCRAVQCCGGPWRFHTTVVA